MQTQAHPDKSHFSAPQWKAHTKHKHCPLCRLEMAKLPVELLPELWWDHTGGSQRTWMHFKACSPGICKEQAGSSNFPFLVFPNLPAQGRDAEGDSCGSELTYSHVKPPWNRERSRRWKVPLTFQQKLPTLLARAVTFPSFASSSTSSVSVSAPDLGEPVLNCFKAQGLCVHRLKEKL